MIENPIPTKDLKIATKAVSTVSGEVYKAAKPYLARAATRQAEKFLRKFSKK